jgi:hypothetical protein
VLFSLGGVGSRAGILRGCDGIVNKLHAFHFCLVGLRADRYFLGVFGSPSQPSNSYPNWNF